MKRSLTRTLQRPALGLAAAFVLTMFGQGLAQAAGTPPNTPISNTATASYTDGNGNTYSTNSNTVTTTVQNAPSLTNTPQAAQNVAPGQVVVDTYTLANTGNAAGDFQIPAAATVSANGTLVGYVVQGSATCTVAAPCTLANANTALAAISVATGATETVGVEYTVSGTATAGSSVTTTLPATITQAAVGAAPAATSATVTATDTDNVLAQARLDLDKSVVSPTTAAAPVAFTINGNNGGGFAAVDLASVKALLGTANPGVVITDLIPQFPAGTPLAIVGTPAVTLNGAGTGTTATIYYSNSATGAAGSWSTTYATGDFYIAVFLTGGSGGVELPSKPANSAGAGAVTTPEVTLTFSTVQPTGSGSANTGSISNLANSVIGGNPGATGVVPVIGPFAGSGEPDSATPTTPITGAVTNTAAGSGTAAPGGNSDIVRSQAFSSSSVVVGPVDAQAATGSFPAAPNNGAGAATNNLDYTAVSFDCGATTAVTSINNGAFACTIPTAGVTVPGTYQNTGNASDTLTLTVTAPAGFIAQAFNATCPATVTTITATTCTKGTAITTASAAGGTVSGTLGTVASGATGSYVIVYTPATAGGTVAPFTGLDSTVTVAGSQGGTIAADTNNTHVDLYPGGPITLSKAQAIAANCPAGSTGQTAGLPCPGGVITYTITYTNTAPATSVAGGTNVGTEPAYAYTGLTAASGTFVITEDGTGANGNTPTNNWATFTNGLNAAPTASDLTVFPAANFTYSPTAGTAAGSTKFVATSAKAITAGTTGTITFAVTVK